MTTYVYTRTLVGGVWNIATAILCTAVQQAFAGNFVRVVAGLDINGDPDPTSVLIVFNVALTPAEQLALDAIVLAVTGQQLPGAFPLGSVYEPLADAASAFNSYRCRNIGTGAQSVHTFMVPVDFQSLVSLQLLFIPNATQNGRTLGINPTYCQVGQGVLTHAPGNTNYLTDYTGGIMTPVDITSAFTPALVAGDMAGILITNGDASTISVIGTLLQYRRNLALDPP